MGHDTVQFLDTEDVYVSEIKVKAPNGVTVRFTPYNGEYDHRFSWPAAWSNDTYEGDDVAYGETLSDEEIADRKAEALRHASEKLGIALRRFQAE